MSFWIFHHITTGNVLCKLKVNFATTTFTDPESRRPNNKETFSLQFLICLFMYFFNIFKKFFQNTQQKNIVIVSLALNLERGGGRGRKKMELMSFFSKEIDARIYSDKIDKCFCSYEIDNCWEEFTVCTGDYLFGWIMYIWTSQLSISCISCVYNSSDELVVCSD